MAKMVTECPACSGRMRVVRLECTDCGTAVEGRFEAGQLGTLPLEQQHFVLTFLRCRGNIKEVERELGISYPTVRGRLDEVLRMLGVPVEPRAHVGSVLEEIERGELTVDEAVRKLKGH